jgi:hypothetical protein
MFYHSFPRPKHGQDGIKKGLAILESFIKNGFLMVPETISYKRDKDDDNSLPPECLITQSRFCLTQIDIGELKAHEKHFGCFHLEFTNQNTYALGAMPVFYLPVSDPEKTEWPLKTLAVSYLSRLFEIQSIIEYIQLFSKKIKDKKDTDSIPIDWEKNTVEVKKLRYVLEIITQKLRPQGAWDKADIENLMDRLLGALQGVSSLFYPTDKDMEGDFDELYYFRQREWRIYAGVCVDGKDHHHGLSKKEMAALKAMDQRFFGKEIVYATGEKRSRVEGCCFMPEAAHRVKPEPGDKEAKSRIEMIPVQRFVERIIVPKEALGQTKAVARKYKFDISRIVDFETAMKIAVSESEYELAKTQCRIQMLKAAIAGC